MFFSDLLDSFLFAYDWELIVDFLIRVVIATVCGAMVGVERTKRFKEAGIRTHCVVAAASAVFMIISKYAFADMAAVVKSSPRVRAAANAEDKVHPVPWVFFVSTRLDGNNVNVWSSALKK